MWKRIKQSSLVAILLVGAAHAADPFPLFIDNGDGVTNVMGAVGLGGIGSASKADANASLWNDLFRTGSQESMLVSIEKDGNIAQLAVSVVRDDRVAAFPTGVMTDRKGRWANVVVLDPLGSEVRTCSGNTTLTGEVVWPYAKAGSGSNGATYVWPFEGASLTVHVGKHSPDNGYIGEFGQNGRRPADADFAAWAVTPDYSQVTRSNPVTKTPFSIDVPCSLFSEGDGLYSFMVKAELKRKSGLSLNDYPYFSSDEQTAFSPHVGAMMKFDNTASSTYLDEVLPDTVTAVDGVFGGQFSLRGRLFTRSSSGNVPYTASLSMLMPNRADYTRIEAVRWYVSADNKTFHRIVDPKRRNSSRYMRAVMPEPEIRYYKAVYKFFSRARLYETSSRQIIAYKRPIPVITGANMTIVGKPLEFTASVANGIASTYTWKVKNLKTLATETSNGDRVVIPAEEPNTYKIDLVATETVPVLSEYPASGTDSQAAQVVVPQGNLVGGFINGPKAIKTGKPYRYVMQMPPNFTMGGKSTDLDFEGEWVLPSGERRSGKTLDWNVSEPGEYVLKYEGRIAQLPHIRLEGKRLVTVTQYVWPEFTIDAKVAALKAPAKGEFVIKLKNDADNEKLGDEAALLTYEWTIPEGIKVLGVQGQRATVDFLHGGNHSLKATVRDSRGNVSQLMSPTFTIEDSKEDVRFSIATAFNLGDNHVPAKLQIVPKVLGAPPGDGIAAMTVLVDGEPVLTNVPPITNSLVLKQEGNHEITTVMTTRRGISNEQTTTVSVEPSLAPECSLSVSSNAINHIVTSSCVVPTCCIAKYEWLVNDERAGGSTASLYLKKASYPQGARIKMKAITGKGQTAEATASVSAQP